MDEKKLGGLLRDIMELFKDSQDDAVTEEEFNERIEIVRKRVMEAFPA